MNKEKKLLIKDSIKAIMIIIAIIVGLGTISVLSDIEESKNIIRVEFEDDPDSTIYKSEMHGKPIRKTVYVYTIYGLLSIDDDNYYYKYNMYEGKKVNSKIEKIIYKDGNFKYKLIEIND